METTPVGKVPAAGTQARPVDHTRPGEAGTGVRGGATGKTAAVDIRLSEAGEEALQTSAPGKAGKSPAHQARALLAERLGESETGAKVPFGQVVSRIARGLDPAEALGAPAGEAAADDGPPAEEEQDEAVDGGASAPAVEASGTGADMLIVELLDELSGTEEQTG